MFPLTLTEQSIYQFPTAILRLIVLLPSIDSALTAPSNACCVSMLQIIVTNLAIHGVEGETRGLPPLFINPSTTFTKFVL